MLTSWYTIKCEDVLHLGPDHDNIRVIGYSDPALEETSVILECISPALLHMGLNITTCMRNGKWEPDPREVECLGESYILIIGSHTIIRFAPIFYRIQLTVECLWLIVVSI